jgi:hypothetical protein
VAIDPRRDHSPHERENTIGDRHPNLARWLLFLGVLALAGIGIWLVPQRHTDREDREGGGVRLGAQSKNTPHGDTKAGSPRQAVGTSGARDAAGEAEGGSVVREIETITGANDAMTLVGRRVDLHVDVQSRVNDTAFWVGSPDNRVLVVLGRDNRNGRKRQQGVPASHGISPVHGGQQATISGVIQPVPRAEHRYSWNLTERDQRDLSDRKIYIRADSVRTDGHGTE